MSLKDRMKDFIKYKRLSQAEFGSILNKSAGWVNNIGYSLKDEQLTLLNEHFPELNKDWLLTGEGEMLNKEEPKPTPITYRPEGKIINPHDFHKKDVYIIPVKGRGGLHNAFYDDLMLNELEIEKLSLKTHEPNGSVWFKIEVEGISMDDSTSEYDGSKYSLCEGDWVYCCSIPKSEWRCNLHFNKKKTYCFFHNIRGIIFKKVAYHNTETGELTLQSLNKDKESFPNFNINIAECSFICNIKKVITEFH